MIPSESERVYRKPQSSDRFRYKLLRGPWSSPGDYVRLLNSFGRSGWEVIQVTYNEDNRPSEVLMKMWVDTEETNDESEG